MSKIPCKGKNAKGEPCRASAGAGGLCYLHANPDVARTNGQKGGHKNRRFIGVDVEVPPNMTATDLNALGSRTISLVLSGQLRAREAGAVAQLMNAQARVIPLLDFEKRIADLERQAARVLEWQQAEPSQGREVPIQADGKDERGGEIATEPVTRTEVQASEHGNEQDTDQVTPSETQNNVDSFQVD